MPTISKRAFTLIELLIVVAIIAILAAIAVPNFLEAQTRAKVTRMMSDMRSTATGIESYRVDHNRYPPWGDWRTTDAPGSDFLNQRYHAKISNFVTTPVAYLTGLSRDVFINTPTYVDTRYPAESGVGFRFQYFPYAELAKIAPSAVTGTKIDTEARAEVTGGYMFYSFGPDQASNQGGAAFKPAAQRVWTRYDPTNGTVSLGNIIRTGRSADGSIPYHPNVAGIQAGPN